MVIKQRREVKQGKENGRCWGGIAIAPHLGPGPLEDQVSHLGKYGRLWKEQPHKEYQEIISGYIKFLMLLSYSLGFENLLFKEDT